MVVERELNSLPEYLLVCNLVVIKWTAAVTGTCMGLFRDLSPRRKILENRFQQSGTGNSQQVCFYFFQVLEYLKSTAVDEILDKTFI